MRAHCVENTHAMPQRVRYLKLLIFRQFLISITSTAKECEATQCQLKTWNLSEQMQRSRSSLVAWSIARPSLELDTSLKSTKAYSLKPRYKGHACSLGPEIEPKSRPRHAWVSIDFLKDLEIDTLSNGRGHPVATMARANHTVLTDTMKLQFARQLNQCMKPLHMKPYSLN